MKAGMSDELASQIPVKFSPEMIRFIANQRLGPEAEK